MAYVTRPALLPRDFGFTPIDSESLESEKKPKETPKKKKQPRKKPQGVKKPNKATKPKPGAKPAGPKRKGRKLPWKT